VKLVVYGQPIPQGSSRAFVPRGWKRPIITADNVRTKPWRQAIIEASREWVDEHGPWPREMSLALNVAFFVRRPPSAPKRRGEPTTKPDLDKLVRAVGDALTDAGVWVDDAQVIATTARKAYAGGPRDPLGAAGPPRAEILVHEAVA
jgi:crossover junction endodeoxyribonuclease RusA